MRLLVITFALLLLTACQHSGRYAQQRDSAPKFVPRPPAMIDAVPRHEEYREANSRAYTVLGKRYYPLATGKGYEAIGEASWYGQKFHGHLTSNGEVYNMFAMTAAHKTLPLPSFVRVTNIDNGKQAIVRVNDRGPFHSNRIIDLSYAAAMKLDYLKSGTARVKLEVIHIDENNLVTVGKKPTVTWEEYAGIVPPKREPEQPLVAQNQRQTKADTPEQSHFIQVAAISDPERAQSLSSVLSTLYQVPSVAELVDNIYKLRIGPLKDASSALELLDELRQNGYPSAFSFTSAM